MALLIQWVGQTSRLQAFLMLSCIVILVESFFSASPPRHSSTTTQNSNGPGLSSLANNHKRSQSLPKKGGDGGGRFHTLMMAHSDLKETEWNTTATEEVETRSAKLSEREWIFAISTRHPADEEKEKISTTESTHNEKQDQWSTDELGHGKENSSFRERKYHSTVTYSNLDDWFHLLKGMEEEGVGHSTGKSDSGSNGRKKPLRLPSEEPTKKPTDHWMF